ncbi:sugar ABC transporter permease (plasmid) [Agrobacterium tumefaciens]|uniref:Sugar ABC transporter permease n=1 Tax=Agrobacterium tumefaciens TaxID=358 RepID=A0AAP9E9P2_AGRTU|nr:sugar ABC transporter permease [Agrobacterium tumefaciens]NSZ61185.1 sugar ABC transporter permease [Agrobacterium tumefaciens]NTZ64159.1 sugar ABC transporter permease [Agrobacterium tumefaciens]QDY97595.1 sugar ABC transporter permease [Agrobacterium tumefaciens]UXS12722.1 sugar ABC transporter permease [Agrobacterium tumefaciens]UXS20084.1 sugar ABC transporter permease [Agrobacterium tumefaciens]
MVLSFRSRRMLSFGMFLVIPAVLFSAAFIYPLIETVILSFQQWDGLSPARTYVGFANYLQLLDQPWTRVAFLNNLQWLIYFLFVPTLAGLTIALLLDSDIRFAYVFRTIFFVPFTITTVAVASIWRWVYRPGTGLMAALFDLVGATPPNWLGDPQIVNYAIMAASLWAWTGFTFLIYFAGLRNLPVEYIEAARLDGASPWAILTRIKLPLLWPSTIVVLGIAGVDSMRVFDIVWSMTQGGPFQSSYVLAVDMYETSFARFRMGEGAAIAVVLTVIAAIVVMPYVYHLSNRLEDVRE